VLLNVIGEGAGIGSLKVALGARVEISIVAALEEHLGDEWVVWCGRELA